MIVKGIGYAAVAAACWVAPALGADAPSYKLVQSIPLGAGERWDYVTFDATANRAFVSHGDHVTVVDLAAGKVAGQIGTFPGGTHGIGIATDTGHGYTDDGKAGTVGVFDLKTFAVTTSLPAAPDADGIVADPASGHFFVVDGDSGTLTVIDPKSNAVAATIKVGEGLEAAEADGNGKLYVNGEENHDMVEVDTRKNTVVAHWPMEGCERPHGIAVDAAARRIFSTCANKVMMVLDADSGRIVTTEPIGSYTDGAAFDPARKLAFSSNGDGTLTVVKENDADHFSVLAPIATALSARTMAIDPKTGRLFLPAADVASSTAPSSPGGRPHVTFAPNSLKLLVFAPQ